MTASGLALDTYRDQVPKRRVLLHRRRRYLLSVDDGPRNPLGPGPGQDGRGALPLSAALTGRETTGFSMTDIAELIRADHMRIRRLFTALDDAARFTRAAQAPGSCPDWTLATVWARIAGLLDAHAEAEYEICCFVMFAHGTSRASELADAILGLNDIRCAVAEARLLNSGSRAWWLAISAARRASSDHIAMVEGGPLADFCRRTSRRSRDDLGRQWAAFRTARRRDAAAPDRPSAKDRHATNGALTPGFMSHHG